MSTDARAVYRGGSEIEVIVEPPPNLNIRHAIFDHDGTISTLREGWERIMEPMMTRAILGERFAEADEALFHRVRERVREFIDQTTGIQTIVQMAGLIELVQEFNLVPSGQILDAAGYKAVYNHELKAMVGRRLAKLDRGELEIADFTIKGAVPFLEDLHGRGVHLYLASGTDDQDVKDEAERLGYAALFTGGIFGSVGVAHQDDPNAWCWSASSPRCRGASSRWPPSEMFRWKCAKRRNAAVTPSEWRVTSCLPFVTLCLRVRCRSEAVEPPRRT